MPLPNNQVPHHILHQVTRKRFNSDHLQRILFGDQKKKQIPRRPAGRSRKSQHWTGIHQGNYYRIKIPDKMSVLVAPAPTTIPKLHTPTSAPLPLKNVTRPHHHILHSQLAGEHGGGGESATAAARHWSFFSSSWWDTLKAWTSKNATILILNFGSICTLVGFTRSDVLELRLLSVTGSVCGMFFHAFTVPRRLTPIAWSALFALVNSAKIYEVLQERAGSVNLTADQEQRYSDFFMPHGITPKQFEAIDGRAKILCVKKGQVIVRQGEVLRHVYLIVKGHTRASVLGRFLTAASFRPVNESSSTRNHAGRDDQQHRRSAAGAAGAWIGEMALLEHVWNEEVKHSPQRKRSHRNTSSDDDDEQSTVAAAKHHTSPAQPETATATVNGRPSSSTTTTPTTAAADNDAKDRAAIRPEVDADVEVKENSNARAMYTIVAQDDCTVLVWSHDEMKTLLAKSPDMKAALTRAMTAAIVGKVVTFTTSRSSLGNRQHQQQPTWLLSSWLSEASSPSSPSSTGAPEDAESLATTMQGDDAAKKKAAYKVDADRLEQDDDDDDDDDVAAFVPDSQENLPRYPVRKFK
jgi:CRP-like cAMP-binding protein